MNKSWEIVFQLPDNCILIGSGKFSQNWTEYLTSEANVLTRTPKISPVIRKDIFQINFLQNDEKT